ncbi:MAG: PEGA domain-containing protein [Myxococcales bacterium]|nr:PEGA domain-containing protein [Myxococcales bacterium]
MKRAVAILVFSGAIVWGSSSRADDGPPQPAAPTVDAAALERAKDLFRRGNELRKIGDCEAALALYLASRAAVASAANTMNAAFCLHQLGREDEALDFYTELVGRFSDALTDADRAAIAPAMAELRKRLGSLEVSSNVGGAVLVDGRMRGQLPLLAPIRVRTGRRSIQVVKDGFASDKRDVTVEAGRTLSIEAELEPLSLSGRLRVACAGFEGASVFIDGAELGACPFEGVLGPGPHVVWARNDAQGSDPTRVEVVLGQTTTLALNAAPIGPELSVRTTPATASLSIDGVSLGASTFQGRLTLGEHVIEASEPGYLSKRSRVSGRVGGQLTVTLEPDATHPRWRAAGSDPIGTFSLGADASALVLSTIGDDVAASCDATCDGSLPVGGRALVRGGWTSRAGVGVGLEAGYQFVERRSTARQSFLLPIGLPDRANAGRLDERVRWSAFAAGVSAFYRRRGDWPIQVGVTGGVMVGPVSSHRQGAFENSAGTAYDAAQEATSDALYVYIAPETRFGRSLGYGLSLSLGVSFVGLVAVTTPRWENDAVVPTSTSPEDRGDGGATFTNESLFGTAMLGLAPSLGLTWEIL